MRRRFGFILAGLFTLPTAFFGLLYYETYWRWRDCFNEEGRCFVEADSVVHHQQNGVLIAPLALCLGLTLIGLALSLGGLRRQGRNPRR
jgi:hypothetical protein